jgi:hypothetical protein
MFTHPEFALFAWLISHQPALLFSRNKPATSNQPAVLFSQNKPAPAISHQPTEQAKPGIRRNCIYLSAPVMIHAFDFLVQLRVWGGVRTYDLERGKFERAVPFCDVKKLRYGHFPPEVWITQNL